MFLFRPKKKQNSKQSFFKVRNLSIHTRSYCQRVEHRRELEKGEAERRIVRKIGYLLHLCALLLAQVKTSPPHLHLSFRHWQVTYNKKGRRRKEAPPSPFPALLKAVSAFNSPPPPSTIPEQCNWVEGGERGSFIPTALILLLSLGKGG